MKEVTNIEITQNWGQIEQWLESGEQIRILTNGIVIGKIIPENLGLEETIEWPDFVQRAQKRASQRKFKTSVTDDLFSDRKDRF